MRRPLAGIMLRQVDPIVYDEVKCIKGMVLKVC